MNEEIDIERARALAAKAGLELRRTPAGVVLAGDGMELLPDFADMLPRIAPGRLGRELLVRAARVKRREDGDGTGAPPAAIDATAGLGQDSFLLAAAGFEVTLFEADLVIAALLADALERAREDTRTSETVRRMHLVAGDAVEGMRDLARAVAAGEGAAPDVVYLDPMFPERRKSAAVKKKFQLLHRLERPCENAAELLDAAISLRPRKVVVKRPAKGEPLAGRAPAHALAGKAIRYDVIVPPRV